MLGRSLKRKRMERRLRAYIEQAAKLLPDENIVHAREFLKHGEYALAVEHLIDCLGDLEIQITGNFADETLSLCSEVQVTERRRDSALRLIKHA